MKTINELNEELRNKRNELREFLGDAGLFKQLKDEEFKKRYDQMSNEIDKLEKERETVGQITAIERYNREQAEKRAILKKLLDTERPVEDITNQDGTLHATKVKKYPKLEAINKELWNFSMIQNKADKWIEARTSGDNYRLMFWEYKNSETIYREFENFEEACKHNGIELKPLNVKKELRNIERLKDETEKMRKQLEAYSERCKKLNGYTLSSIGAIERRQEYHYNFR